MGARKFLICKAKKDQKKSKKSQKTLYFSPETGYNKGMKVEKEPVMKYEIFQIQLTNAQIDEVNTSKDYPEFYTKYLNTTFRPSADRIVSARDMYSKVAVIEATSLEDVFDIGNIGPESAIERLAPMHSLSVGDVVVDESGKAMFVDSFGFGEVAFN